MRQIQGKTISIVKNLAYLISQFTNLVSYISYKLLAKIIYLVHTWKILALFVVNLKVTDLVFRLNVAIANCMLN